jgi:hypothetical protein
MYSYVTAGAAIGFDVEFMGINPSRSRLGIPWWCPPCSPRGCVRAECSGGG